MKMLIDISEELYKALLNGYEEPYSRMFSDVIKNGTPLSQNATNGDVIKALFPQIVTQEILDGEIIVINGIVDCSMAFGREMWNAPYKAESENKK